MRKPIALFLSLSLLTGQIMAADTMSASKAEIQKQIVSQSQALDRLQNELADLQDQVQQEINDNAENVHSRNVDLVIAAGSLISTLYFGHRATTRVNDPDGIPVAVMAGVSLLTTAGSTATAVGRQIVISFPSEKLPNLRQQLANKKMEIENLKLQLKTDFMALE